MERRLKIAVLMGGVSSERDVSLRSGQAVGQALREAGHDVLELDVTSRDVSVLSGLRPDVVFIALHGDFGEDGQVQAKLEAMALAYTGSGPTASFVGMDKIESKRQFVAHAVPTPDYFVVRPDESLDAVLATAEALGYPLVCKPARNGSSCGVSVVRDSKEFVAGLCGALDYGCRALVERFVRGRELTVGILDGAALPVIEVVPKRPFFTYEAKYVDAETEYRMQVNLPPATARQVEELSERAFQALGCRQFGRVDLIYGEDGKLYVLEVNTIPGMTARSLLPKAAKLIGMDFVRLCSHLAVSAWRREKLCVRQGAPLQEELRHVG